MQKLWALVMIAGGVLVFIAIAIWVDDGDCGSDRDCGYLVGLTIWFWTLLVLGIAALIAGFILQARHQRRPD
ncbi:hypothetical protein [Microbacterium sp. CFBP9034]|uniref:hypothetical protein n=1 Tax=Microbacterium sp. CFBP9034 TaxID=3096540 RepID=UPI002A6A30CF|nr:hypothetical protein [Microbacterium sp. CFBP9034]MDY0909705.1 hypothetical protein [Microbacterium sp. CFBP9034]